MLLINSATISADIVWVGGEAGKAGVFSGFVVEKTMGMLW